MSWFSANLTLASKLLPNLSMSFGVGSDWWQLRFASKTFQDLAGTRFIGTRTNGLSAGQERGSSWDIYPNISHQMEEEKNIIKIYLSRWYVSSLEGNGKWMKMGGIVQYLESEKFWLFCTYLGWHDETVVVKVGACFVFHGTWPVERSKSCHYGSEEWSESIHAIMLGVIRLPMFGGINANVWYFCVFFWLVI